MSGAGLVEAVEQSILFVRLAVLSLGLDEDAELEVPQDGSGMLVFLETSGTFELLEDDFVRHSWQYCPLNLFGRRGGARSTAGRFLMCQSP